MTNGAAEVLDKGVGTVESITNWFADNRADLPMGLAVAAGIVAAMLGVRWIGSWMLAGDPNRTRWRGVIGGVLTRTKVWFMVAAALDIVVTYAAVPARVGRLIDILFIIAFALQGAIWARELILGSIARRVGEDSATTLGNATSIIRVLVSVALFALAIIVIFENLGANVTALIAGLGIGGIAIGLAAQGIFSDLFAGLAIVFDKPFRRGQQISWGGRDASGVPYNIGTVERTGLKTTRIRSRTGEQIIVANTKLLEQELTNVDEAKVYRFWLPFGVIYQTAPEVLERMGEIVEEALKPLKGVRLVRCTVRGFGPSSIEIDLVYDDHGRDFDTRARNRSDICIGIARIFAREKIEFAYPTQTTFTAAPDGTMVMPYAQVQPDVRVDEEDAPKSAGKVR
ncbi:MAG TPA: mechanosensitive ion channel domain-containing protein [Sphingomicrobium sp.]|nr:mechanosensitive ion channel domain-containing protein [Sphingomicrobium sp.]